MEAKHILLIANGEGKADALYQSLFGPITPQVPASILQLHDDVSIVADEAALSRIIEKILFNIYCFCKGVPYDYKNGLVWEESGSFLTKDLHIDSDTHRIAMDSADTADDTIIDASGLYVIPGLVDIHIHGAMGCDFSDGSAEGLLKIAKYLRSCGVTAFCPTSMTLPENQLLTAFASTREIPDDNSHAFIAGIHMEGPFLSPEKKVHKSKLSSRTGYRYVPTSFPGMR